MSLHVELCLFFSQTALQRCNVNFFRPDFWGEFFDVNILGGEFLEGEFLRGLFLLEKIGPKNSTPEFWTPKFGAQKSASQNSTPNSGSRGAKSPLRKLAPDFFEIVVFELSRVFWMSVMMTPFHRAWAQLGCTGKLSANLLARNKTLQAKSLNKFSTHERRRKFRAGTGRGYTRDRSRRNFLEVLLPWNTVKQSKNRLLRRHKTS